MSLKDMVKTGELFCPLILLGSLIEFCASRINMLDRNKSKLLLVGTLHMETIPNMIFKRQNDLCSVLRIHFHPVPQQFL